VGYMFVELLGVEGWRWMLASAAIFAALIALVRIGTPESARWLLSVGRTEEACRVIEKALHQSVTPADLVGTQKAEQEQGSISELFRGIYLRRIVFIIIFFTCNIIPLFALLTFGPQLFSSLGMGSGNLSNLGLAFINLVFAVGCLPAMRLLETVGRRKTIIWSFGLKVLPLLALGIWLQAPGPVVMALLCLYALFSSTPEILQWGYPNELFPTRIRAAATGMAIGMSRFGAAAGTFLVPVSLAKLGTPATMIIAAGITFVGFLACVLWAEETKNRSLEDTAASEVLPAAPRAETEPAIPGV
jgi:putative MFS transporter